MHFKVVVSRGDCVQSWGGEGVLGGWRMTFHMLNQPWNVHLIIPRNSPGLLCCSRDLHLQPAPILIITSSRPRTDKEREPPLCPVLWHVHASLCGCVFVLVCWAHSPLMSSRNTELSWHRFSIFSPVFFVRWDFGGSQTGSPACTFAPWEEKRMIDVIFQETSSKENTWSESVTVFPAAPCYFYFSLKKSWTGF